MRNVTGRPQHKETEVISLPNERRDQAESILSDCRLITGHLSEHRNERYADDKVNIDSKGNSVTVLVHMPHTTTKVFSAYQERPRGAPPTISVFRSGRWTAHVELLAERAREVQFDKDQTRVKREREANRRKFSENFGPIDDSRVFPEDPEGDSRRRSLRKAIDFFRRLDGPAVRESGPKIETEPDCPAPMEHYSQWIRREAAGSIDPIQFADRMSIRAPLEFWVKIALADPDRIADGYRPGRMETTRRIGLNVEQTNNLLFPDPDLAPAFYCDDHPTAPALVADLLERFEQTSRISWEGTIERSAGTDCGNCHPFESPGV